MFVKLQLWKARRNLLNATQHERNLRESVQHMQREVLPRLERELEQAEIKDFYKKFGRY